MRSSISSSALHSAILASLALGAASGVSLGQAFNIFPPPTDTAPTATITPTTGVFRISNLGTVAAPSTNAPLATSAAGTFTDTDNYLSEIGRFTLANDYPILGVTLSLKVEGAFSETGAALGMEGQDNRSTFLMHDFGLLFVGNAAASIWH